MIAVVPEMATEEPKRSEEAPSEAVSFCSCTNTDETSLGTTRNSTKALQQTTIARASTGSSHGHKHEDEGQASSPPRTAQPEPQDEECTK
eukprot:CAMPEP_0118964270 /NCGR_PEP_ID=MMETSP1173-20130426/1997_1 /TAXON_ID=1034831 /ORGANISM="Rhizochromulina marina cf, Strain CCMP1243" /LENGTH=89 /DNA_ID=CAMNT_0006912701 /DNA_START=1 /DNA_END=267 /DNA_ORIENTATION=+